MMMSTLLFILGAIILFVCIKLKIENAYLRAEKKEDIAKVKKSIQVINEKQTVIFDKLLLTKSSTTELNTEVKQLSNEVLALHYEFITKYAK